METYEFLHLELFCVILYSELRFRFTNAQRQFIVNLSKTSAQSELFGLATNWLIKIFSPDAGEVDKSIK